MRTLRKDHEMQSDIEAESTTGKDKPNNQMSCPSNYSHDILVLVLIFWFRSYFEILLDLKTFVTFQWDGSVDKGTYCTSLMACVWPLPLTWWEVRTKVRNLSSDFCMCTVTYVHPHSFKHHIHINTIIINTNFKLLVPCFANLLVLLFIVVIIINYYYYFLSA